MNCLVLPRLAVAISLFATMLWRASAAAAQERDNSPAPQEGPVRMLDKDGNLVSEDHYHQGKLHGPSRRWSSKGRLLQEFTYDRGLLHGPWMRNDGTSLIEATYRQGKLHGPFHSVPFSLRERSGSYLDGELDGEWTEEGPGGASVEHWKLGVRDGKWSWSFNDNKDSLAIEFQEGRLASVPKELQKVPLLEHLGAFAIPKSPRDPIDERVMEVLWRVCDLEYPQTPLKDVAQDLSERFGIPTFVDRPALNAHNISVESPVSIKDRQGPLLLGLIRMAKQNGLVCDYRFHAIWFTTPGAARWKDDPTGMSQLKVTKGSELEQALASPIDFDFARTSLARIAGPLERLHGITVKLDSTVRGDRRAGSGRGGLERQLPVRDVLAILLYVNECHCRVENGKLIVEPQTPLQ